MANRIVTPPEGWSQAKQRAIGVFYDQHKSSTFTTRDATTGETVFPFLDGRPWWADIEKSTGMPVGPLYPMGWQAPWVPPMHYINQSIGKVDAQGRKVETNGMQLRWFKIDYQQMAKDYREAMLAYYQNAINEAVRLNLPTPDYGDPISFKLRTIIGPPPMDPRVPQAAAAGNPWLLGMAVANVHNPLTGRMEVEEDALLARLLRSQHETILTAEQAERKSEEKREADAMTRELVEQMRAMQAEMAEMRQADAARKAAEAEKQAKKAEQMAVARAARGKPKSTPVGV